ncbi:MAG: hypothetical protein DI538_06225 [Azospira oryzae]|nr:MAG: hypothetical protein DI538_06225 [Azospira oryzae]
MAEITNEMLMAAWRWQKFSRAIGIIQKEAYLHTDDPDNPFCHNSAHCSIPKGPDAFIIW